MAFVAVFGAPAKTSFIASKDKELGIQDMKNRFGLQDPRYLERKGEADEHPLIRVYVCSR
jgi:hypothetical protein